ncbi:MAG: FtsX-like permease family protein [Sulfurovaceae bacterium]|nr:FtsX-like permease family protein [Sulfurovaceae bacterium]
MVIALKALSKNKFKTTLIFISMVISIMAIFLISAIADGVVGMYSAMLKTDGDIVVTQKGVADTFFSDINRSIGQSIAKIQGVKSISSLVLGAAPVNKLPIVGIYGVSQNRFNSYKLKSGHYPKAGEVLLGYKIYQTLNQPSFVNISKKIFRVSGTFESKIGFEDGGVVMNIDEAGDIFHKNASILLVSVKNIQDGLSITKKINAISNEIEAKTADSFIDSYNQFKIIKTSSDVISILALTMGVIGIVSMMSMVVNDRKAEFGIMRSIGLSSWGIINELLIETIIIAIVAYIVAFGASELVLDLIKQVDKFQGYINGEITFALALKVGIVSLLMALLGAFMPAIYASRIDPMSLIQRGES